MGTEINLRQLKWFILAFLLVYITGLFIDVMCVDAAQYAAISREMLVKGHWLQVHNRGADYLDKPSLLFWLSASAFKIFGFSNWAYKLPSFLFAILGIYSTAKLGELLYDKKTGIVAALMLASGLGTFIMVNDIRTDTILLGATVFATWQILLFVKTKRWGNLLLGFIGVALAMLAKGPLGLMFPLLALSSDFAYKRQWKNFFRWQWIVGLLLVALLLLPMCYGLYEQFDLHPEKVVNGSTNVSGLRFYFWTQSFGRLTGESQWGTKFDNGAGPFFFTHTFLWAFFPWSFFTIGGLILSFARLIKSKLRAGFLPEMLSVGGFVLVFVALSASRYKLPHYIYVTFPLAALIAARFLLHDVLRETKKGLRYFFLGFHVLIFLAVATVCVLVLLVIFPGANLLTITGTFAWLFAALIFAWKLKEPFQRLIYPLLSGLLALYFVLDSHFYPSLLKYQSSNTAGRIVAENKVPEGHFFLTNDISDYSADFYSGTVTGYMHIDSAQVTAMLQKTGDLWLYTDQAGAEQLHSGYYPIAKEWKFEDYSVQFLTFPFLNPKTRPEKLRQRYLFELNSRAKE